VVEVLPDNIAGGPRDLQVVTFGVPFSLDQDIQIDADTGRPALRVIAGVTKDGSKAAIPSIYQFKTVETWPSTGAVRWALVDVLMAGFGSNQTAPIIVTDDGTGVPPELEGLEIATDEGDTIRFQTGDPANNTYLDFTISKTNFNLFKTVTVNQIAVVQDSSEVGVFGTDSLGGPLLPTDVTVTLEENGPCRAVAKVEGTLQDGALQRVIDFTLRIIARAGSNDVEVTFTARNAADPMVYPPAHVQLGSIELGLTLALEAIQPGGDPTATIPTHDPGTPTVVQGLPADDSTAFLYMAQTSATVNGLSMSYVPHIPKQNGSDTELVDQGYQISLLGVDQHSLGNKNEYPTYGFLNLRNALGGVTVFERQMQFLWPGAIEATGDGRVIAGVFTKQNAAGYSFLWQQHESRTVVFSFHRGPMPEPYAIAHSYEFPLAARVTDYEHYRDSGVFPYRLVTQAQSEEALAKMNIPYTFNVENRDQEVLRYLFAKSTGGPNNFASIETLLAGEWLRHGMGGGLITALDQALWKCEWQIRRSDGWLDDQNLLNSGELEYVAVNEGDFTHTTGQFGDPEHRYREGIILAYYLTGDQRFRDAILDEAEVLKTIDITFEHERYMYRTNIAIARVFQFTVDDPVAFPAPEPDPPKEEGDKGGGAIDLGGDTALLQTLITRLEYFTENSPTSNISGVNLCVDTEGAGWATGPLGILAFVQDVPGGLIDGSRGYYVAKANFGSPPGDEPVFKTRGFISSEFGPTSFYHAAKVLDPANPDHVDMLFNARARMRDLTWYTFQELYPLQANPLTRKMVYEYWPCEQDLHELANDNFHPITMGMAETYLDFDSVGQGFAHEKLLVRASEMLQAAFATSIVDHPETLVQRLDVQHLFSVFLESGIDLSK
jgi:hypothetical protein